MTTSASTLPAAPATGLGRLYAARAAFAIVWAAIVLAVAPTEISVPVGILLVLYPVYDLVGIATDARLGGGLAGRPDLVLNLAVSGAAAIALVVATTSGVPAVLRVWGAWAVVSGLAQLSVAVRRRAVGGQLPLILSGAISVLAGGGFVAMAGGDDPSVSGVGGYALLGGLFFLASSILLRRRNRKA